MTTGALQTTDFASEQVQLTLVAAHPELAPYISGYYRTRLAPGAVIEDWMPPEEANLRAGRAALYTARTGPGELLEVPEIILSGPTDRGTHVRMADGEFWGIGLTPAGWSRFIALPANEYANRFVDLGEVPRLSHLHAMLGQALRHSGDAKRVVALFDDTLRALLGDRRPLEDTIHAVHRAFGGGQPLATTQLAQLAGMNQRTFERFCKRHFGFSPAVLQRRRRFLRSLGRYMLDPSMRWIGSLDAVYSDQAHFIREFRAVMGMTPGEYAERPHPIVGAAVRITNAAAGVAMQALHTPPPSAAGEGNRGLGTRA